MSFDVDVDYKDFDVKDFDFDADFKDFYFNLNKSNIFNCLKCLSVTGPFGRIFSILSTIQKKEQ
jgi:hypothetical protein